MAHGHLAELGEGKGGKQGHVLVLREHLNAHITLAKPVKSVKVSLILSMVKFRQSEMKHIVPRCPERW